MFQWSEADGSPEDGESVIFDELTDLSTIGEKRGWL
jgi:hypothetical protein